MNLKILGNNIRKARQMRGLTQENVANDLDCSLNTYTKIERGETNVPFMRLVQIADYLKVNIVTFVQNTEEYDQLEMSKTLLQIKDEIHKLQDTLNENCTIYKNKHHSLQK